MKFLVILLLAASTSAAFLEGFEKASEDVFRDFSIGMEQSTPLHLVLGVEDNEDIRRLERDVKEELEKYMREAFDQALERIKEAVKNGKKVNELALQKLHELKEKMKELNIGEDEIEKKELKDLKEMVDGHLRQILEKMGIFDKRSIDEKTESITGDLDLRNILLKLKEYILEKMDINAVKNSLAKVVGQATQRLCEWLTSKGKTKVLNFFDRLMEKDDDKKRSVSDLYQQVKDYFDELNIELKEKFLKFGEWARDVIEKGLLKSKNRIENIRNIAREFLKKTKEVKKEVAAQALEFFRQHKEELGTLYDDVYEKVIKYIDNYDD